MRPASGCGWRWKKVHPGAWWANDASTGRRRPVRPACPLRRETGRSATLLGQHAQQCPVGARPLVVGLPTNLGNLGVHLPALQTEMARIGRPWGIACPAATHCPRRGPRTVAAPKCGAVPRWAQRRSHHGQNARRRQSACGDTLARPRQARQLAVHALHTSCAYAKHACRPEIKNPRALSRARSAGKASVPDTRPYLGISTLSMTWITPFDW